MTQQAVNEVLARLAEDETFLNSFLQDPEEVLQELDLSNEEKAALLELDMSTLEEVGGDVAVIERVRGPLGDKCPARSKT